MQAHPILKDALTRIGRGEDLNSTVAAALFQSAMEGGLSEGQLGVLLGALLAKGESVDELVGAARAMRARAVAVRCEEPHAVDTCGTGGDGISTFNVSTCAAIIAAAAGATVAKHGNRSTTRVCGSTEVLSELGVNVEADVATVERCLREAGIGYLNARLLHPAMKVVAPIRLAIPVRTIFNLLGPLTNPAGVRRQLVGVPRPELLEKMAAALAQLGAVYAWVVHGHGGLCDVSITGPTRVCAVENGALRTFVVSPQDAGLPTANLEELLVESPAQSAGVILSILRGEARARRDHALLNAAAALVVAGRASRLADGVALAAQAIDSGAALAKLEQWKSLTTNSS
jgi:anthranilate phosphoribosyltransferase